MTPLQTATALALVRVFETGRVAGAYGVIEALTGDKGFLRYGEIRADLADGTLPRLIQAYGKRDDARHAKAFQVFANTLRDRNPALRTDRYFHNLLRAAADDPAMQALQDDHHRTTLWEPALAEADKRGLETALGRALVYESRVQGSWETLRRRTNKAHEPMTECGEASWVGAYVAERLDWLSNHRKPSLRAGAFRMEVFSELVRLGNWDLRLPLVVRGTVIDAAALSASPLGLYDGPAVRSRTLSLTDPLTRGADVRLVQLALSGLTVGRHVSADGIFGPQTADAVRTLQDMLGYPATGSVGPTDYDSLKL